MVRPHLPGRSACDRDSRPEAGAGAPSLPGGRLHSRGQAHLVRPLGGVRHFVQLLDSRIAGAPGSSACALRLRLCTASGTQCGVTEQGGAAGAWILGCFLAMPGHAVQGSRQRCRSSTAHSGHPAWAPTCQGVCSQFLLATGGRDLQRREAGREARRSHRPACRVAHAFRNVPDPAVPALLACVYAAVAVYTNKKMWAHREAAAHLAPSLQQLTSIKPLPTLP